MLYLKNSADDTFSLQMLRFADQHARRQTSWQQQAAVLCWPAQQRQQLHSHVPDFILLVLLALLLLLGQPAEATVIEHRRQHNIKSSSGSGSSGGGSGGCRCNLLPLAQALTACPWG